MKPFIDWYPIKTVPFHTLVLLTGDSGMLAPKDRFICNGYCVPSVHSSVLWRDIQNDSLADMFPDGPTHWAELPNFPDSKNLGE
jgi:hypothetical protein